MITVVSAAWEEKRRVTCAAERGVAVVAAV
jgi:hypothetical protein